MHTITYTHGYPYLHMDIHSWIMCKSINDSNKIYQSYLTRLFSYVLSTIGYMKLHIMYLFQSEILTNVMTYILSYIDQMLTATVGPYWIHYGIWCWMDPYFHLLIHCILFKHWGQGWADCHEVLIGAVGCFKPFPASWPSLILLMQYLSGNHSLFNLIN